MLRIAFLLGLSAAFALIWLEADNAAQHWRYHLEAEAQLREQRAQRRQQKRERATMAAG